MGCSIHAHFEIKVDGKWHCYSTLNLDRNYRLFNKMAGVRGGNETEAPISQPKGLPNDVSFITNIHAKVWTYDMHSASWLGYEELLELQDWYERHSNRMFAFHDQFGYFFGHGLEGLMDDTDLGVTDVRLVFWFDN